MNDISLADDLPKEPRGVVCLLRFDGQKPATEVVGVVYDARDVDGPHTSRDSRFRLRGNVVCVNFEMVDTPGGARNAFYEGDGTAREFVLRYVCGPCMRDLHIKRIVGGIGTQATGIVIGSEVTNELG